MPNDLFLFQFLFRQEALWVLKTGRREWGDLFILLDVYHPRVGCHNLFEIEAKCWIRVYGIPTHLWC